MIEKSVSKSASAAVAPTRRRHFLFHGGCAVLGACLNPLTLRGAGLKRDALTDALEAHIPKLMQQCSVPGISMAVVQNGRLRWRRAFGVKDNATRRPVDDGTLFEAASVSKTVFAYAVMKLCEQGVLNLDTPLVRYGAPSMLEGDARMGTITARHVLSHTSGFQDFRSRKDPLAIHFTPGEKFLYSGEGYYYLQSVVTHLTGRVDRDDCATYESGLKVCGTDFDAYLKRTLLKPFGMRQSGYLWNDTLDRHAAHPHDTNGNPSAKRKPRPPDVARYGACGGLHTTATEYARFLIEVLDPRNRGASRLAQDTCKEMLRPQIGLPEDQTIDGADSWALGWAVRRRNAGNVILHSGGQPGFQSLTMASVPRKSGFVCLTNSDNGWKVFHHSEFIEIVNGLLAS